MEVKMKTKTLIEEIELWKLKSFGMTLSQSPKFKELDRIIKQFIKKILDEIKELGFQEQNPIYRDGLIDCIKMIKQKAGEIK